MKTVDPEGVVAVSSKYAWEAATLMLEGLEHSVVHKEEQWFGKQVGALKTGC